MPVDPSFERPAFSRAADDLKLLSTAEKLLNTDSSALLIAAAALLGGGEHAGALTHPCASRTRRPTPATLGPFSNVAPRATLAEAGLIYLVPDDNTALVAVQAGTGLLAGAGALTLFATSSVFGLLQGSD